MPHIVPISDLRNYISILQNVSVGSPVYLTPNGRGCYAIVDIAEQEEYKKTKAALRLMCELEEGRKSGEENGWLSAQDVRNRFLGEKRMNTIYYSTKAQSNLDEIYTYIAEKMNNLRGVVVLKF